MQKIDTSYLKKCNLALKRASSEFVKHDVDRLVHLKIYQVHT